MITGWTAATVVAGEQILHPGTVTVAADGTILDIVPGTVPGATDLGSVLLVPGAVDLHCDAVERLAEPRPGVRMPFGTVVRALDSRLAGAGVTTGFVVISLAGDGTGLRQRSVTEALAGELLAIPAPRVRHRLHLRVDVTDEASVRAAESLLARGVVDLLSVMNHTPQRCTRANGYVAFHGGNDGVGEVDLANRTAVTAAAPYLDRRMGRLAVAARRAGVPLAWHVPDSAAAIAVAAARGAAIAEFPTTMAAAAAAALAGLAVAVDAPNLLLRRSTGGSLSALDALARGVVGVLVSDYYPEALWPAALGCGLALPQAVSLVSSAPARVAGLVDRGELQPGQRADMVALRRDGTVVRTIVGGHPTF